MIFLEIYAFFSTRHCSTFIYMCGIDWINKYKFFLSKRWLFFIFVYLALKEIVIFQDKKTTTSSHCWSERDLLNICCDLNVTLFNWRPRIYFTVKVLWDNYFSSWKTNVIILLEGAVKEKWKGYRMKPENLRNWTIHIRHPSNVPASRNWYKTVSKLCKKSYICNFV